MNTKRESRLERIIRENARLMDQLLSELTQIEKEKKQLAPVRARS